MHNCVDPQRQVQVLVVKAVKEHETRQHNLFLKSAVGIEAGICMAKHNATNLNSFLSKGKNGYIRVSGEVLSFTTVQSA
jgi:hypothetical protein